MRGDPSLRDRPRPPPGRRRQGAGSDSSARASSSAARKSCATASTSASGTASGSTPRPRSPGSGSGRRSSRSPTTCHGPAASSSTIRLPRSTSQSCMSGASARGTGARPPSRGSRNPLTRRESATSRWALAKCALTPRTKAISAGVRVSLATGASSDRPVSSMPSRSHVRRHSSPRSAPGRGRTTTWTCDGGRSACQRSRIRGTSWWCQKLKSGSSLATRAKNLRRVVGDPCLTRCCQALGTWRTRSRAVITRCTSSATSSRRATAFSAFAREVSTSCSWLIRASPSQPSTSSTTRSQAPSWCCDIVSRTPALSRTTAEARNWPSAEPPGSSSPRSASASRWCHHRLWR